MPVFSKATRHRDFLYIVRALLCFVIYTDSCSTCFVFFFLFMCICIHLKSIKNNLAKRFGSANSYNSLIHVLLYWDFIIWSESLHSKKWTLRSLRFCKSQASLGFVNSEPFTTVVFIHYFLQGSGELKTLWLKQTECVREKTLPHDYAFRNTQCMIGTGRF